MGYTGIERPFPKELRTNWIAVIENVL